MLWCNPSIIGTLQISGLPPFTYDAMLTAGLTAADSTPLMNGNIARILCEQLVKDKGGAVTIPDDLLSVLNEVKEIKKKNKVKKGVSKDKALVVDGTEQKA